MRASAKHRTHRIQVIDELAPAGSFDYADAFEVHLSSPDVLAPRSWLARGLDDSPAAVQLLTSLLLRVRDEPTTSPEDLSDWHVIASTADLIHIERTLPLLHVVLVGRRLDPFGRRLTTLLTYERPVLSRVLWTFIGIGHRLAVRRLICHGIPSSGAVGGDTARAR